MVLGFLAGGGPLALLFCRFPSTKVASKSISNLDMADLLFEAFRLEAIGKVAEVEGEGGKVSCACWSSKWTDEDGADSVLLHFFLEVGRMFEDSSLLGLAGSGLKGLISCLNLLRSSKVSMCNGGAKPGDLILGCTRLSSPQIGLWSLRSCGRPAFGWNRCQCSCSFDS